MAHYHTQFASDPKLEGYLIMSGPQDESQIPEEVKKLLELKGVHTVTILFNHGVGERAEIYKKMKEDGDAREGSGQLRNGTTVSVVGAMKWI